MSVIDVVQTAQPVRRAHPYLAGLGGFIGVIVLMGALIVFAQRIGVGVVVAGAIAVGGTFLPGDLPHVDTPDTLPGPPNVVAQTVSSTTSLSLNPAGINWKVPPN